MSSANGRLAASGRQLLRRRHIGPLGLAQRLLEGRQALLAGVDRGDVALETVAQGGELVGRHVVFAGGGAEREQALLGLFELARIELGRPDRLFERLTSLVDGDEGGVEGAHAGLDEARRLRAAALEFPHRSGQHGNRRRRAGDRLERFVQLARHLLGLHHDETALGERRLLPGLGLQSRQFFDRVAQEIGLLARLLDAGAVLVERRPRLAHATGGVGHCAGLRLQAAEGVEDRAVGDRVDQRPVVVLAVDFDQRRADAAQDLDAHRLIVDEGAGAPVGDLDAAEDEIALGVDIGIGGDAAGGVIERTVEDRRHLSLRFAVPDEAAVAARAEGEREGIEQDGLAGAGFTREDAEALREMKLEPVDQDDVADRQLDQHARSRLYPVFWPTRGTPRKALLIQDSVLS